MVKYFINLSKIKECAKEFLKNPRKENRPLIAAVGPKEKPEYLFFLDVTCMKNSFKISVEHADNLSIEEYIFLDDEDWMQKIKKAVTRYDRFYEEEEEFKKFNNSCTAICQNPECVEYGNMVDIISDAMGRKVCPNCGEVIEDRALTESPDEDDVDEDDFEEIDRERLLEITYNLILFFLYTPNEGYDLDMADELNIEMDEIHSIEDEYMGDMCE